MNINLSPIIIGLPPDVYIPNRTYCNIGGGGLYLSYDPNIIGV